MLALRLRSSSGFFSPPIFSPARRKVITLFFPVVKNKTKRTQNRQTDKSKRNKPGILSHAPPRKIIMPVHPLLKAVAALLSPRGRIAYFFRWLTPRFRRTGDELFEGKNVSPQIRTPADEQTTVDSGLFHLPVRETLLSEYFKIRISRW